MVVVTFLVVVLRYAFNQGWIARQESITYMHALLFMLGAAYTLKLDGHVRVDIVYQRCSKTTRAWIDLLGSLLLLLPVCVFIGWSSWDYVATAWTIKEGSGEAGGLPTLYLLKTSILIMAALLILQGISMTLKCLTVLLGSSSVPDDKA